MKELYWRVDCLFWFTWDTLVWVWWIWRLRMNSCQFLNVARCQHLFGSGKAIQGERVFRELKSKAQLQIQGMLTRREGPLLYVGRTLLGSIFPSLCTGLDERISQIWKESSSEKKARVLEDFMDVRVAAKLEKELRDAQDQERCQKPYFKFDIASTQFPHPPFFPLSRPPTSQFPSCSWLGQD